jgi:hypothetical protein
VRAKNAAKQIANERLGEPRVRCKTRTEVEDYARQQVSSCSLKA